MFRCIQLAKNGLGSTYPNPLVGSVIVHENKIIGEGWHYESGKPHAEVNAIDSVEDKSLLKDATIYVSLEPCSHFGKTPPCADRIISEGIRKVIIGSTDPNPQVSGNGIRKLQNAACEVVSGVLKEDCDELNKRFFTFHSKKRPYIILKWAQTSNGYLAPDFRRNEKAPVWITNKISRQLVHKMRAEEGAILVGSNTIIADDPSLTVRNWDGPSPLRIVLNGTASLPPSSKIFDGQVPTLIFEPSALQSNYDHVEIISTDDKKVLPLLCEELFRRNIQSLIVEGGATTLSGFIDSNLWDEAHIFEGSVKFENGISAPGLVGKITSKATMGTDSLRILKNTER